MSDNDTKNENGLLLQQQKFVDAYVVTMSATEAARIANYAHPAQQGSRLLKHPGVKNAIKEAVAEASATLGVDSQWVIKKLVDTINICENTVTPVTSSKTGKPIKDGEGNPVFKRDNANLLRALELLGKALGMWKDIIDVKDTTERGPAIDYGKITAAAVARYPKLVKGNNDGE